MDRSLRLYFDAPECLEFDARVLACTPAGEGFYDVRLDRTAFYPTSGGQPHDTGTLGGAHVTEVFETEDGTIVHRCDAGLELAAVAGCIDAERRRDHTQQHSGQHLLSATCVALLARPTAAFHLGAERCTIDLPGARLDADAIAAVESRANAIVREARPVRAQFVSAAEARALGADPPAVAGLVRLVEIEGWDRNPCCGTHVRATSEIGPVKILAQDRVGNAARLHFVCGERALAAFGRTQAALDALTRLLGRPLESLVQTVEEMQQHAKAQRKEIDAAQAAWAAAAAALWMRDAPRAAGVAVVARQLPPDASLTHAAAALVACGAIALLGRGGVRADLLFQRPASLDLDLRPVMQAACEAVGGRGGGAASRVQGAGTRCDAIDTALAVAEAAVLRGLSQSF